MVDNLTAESMTILSHEGGVKTKLKNSIRTNLHYEDRYADDHMAKSGQPGIIFSAAREGKLTQGVC